MASGVFLKWCLLAWAGAHTLFVGGAYLAHFHFSRFVFAPSSWLLWARSFLCEWLYTVGAVLTYPFGLRQERLPTGASTPLLLVHGYGMNRACFFVLRWRLRRAGYGPVYAVNVSPLFADLDKLAAQVGVAAKRLSAACGGAKVVAIGHSQGGVLLRRALQLDDETPIANIITLGSPHRGTYLARLGVGTNARQLRYCSSYLQAMEQLPQVPLLSIYSDADAMVCPTESAAFGQAQVRLQGAGHFALLVEGRAFAALRAALPAAGGECEALGDPRVAPAASLWRVLLPLLAVGLPLALTWQGRLQDVELYYRYAHGMASGAVPYRDLAIEYPPGALLVFGFPALLANSLPAYAALFIVSMAVFDGVMKVALWRSAPRRQTTVLLLAMLASVALYYTYLRRFDLSAACVVALAALLLARNSRSLGSWMLLAVGAAIKLYPLVLAPFWALFSLRTGASWRRLLAQVSVALVIGAGSLGTMRVLAGARAESWLSYFGTRGLHVASTYGSALIAKAGIGGRLPMAFRYGTHELTSALASNLARWSLLVTLGLLVVTLLIYARALLRTNPGPAVFWRGSTALLVALLLGSKVLSPQYVIWLLPLWVMACTQGERLDKPLALGMLLVAVLTAATHPGEGRIASGSIERQLALLGRNGLLVCTWLYLLVKPGGDPCPVANFRRRC